MNNFKKNLSKFLIIQKTHENITLHELMSEIISESIIMNFVTAQFRKFISKKKFIKQNLNENKFKKITKKQLCQEKKNHKNCSFKFYNQNKHTIL